MADALTVERAVALEPHRCFECGRWWAYERFAHDSPECPVCARRCIERYSKRIAELERSNAALRGAVTRAQERRR